MYNKYQNTSPRGLKSYLFETEKGAFSKSEWFIKFEDIYKIRNDERKKTVKEFADKMIIMMPSQKEDIEALAKQILEE